MLSYANPLGKELYAPANNLLTKVSTFHIIGVMKDFNFRSLRENVTPLAILFGNDQSLLSIRVHAGTNIPGLLAQVEDKWRVFSPSQAFVYSFMEQDFDGLYRAEQRMGQLFVTFSALAILIACLGLFGLATYAAEQRTKEIGIRKVLGAGVSTIVGMLSRDFVRLVLLSIVIASPLAWLVMRKWLQGFANRIDISGWIFVAAGMIALVIAVLTVSVQTIRAASANPVKSLRSE
jgi:putative ABC transport system permease protein